MRGRSRDLHTAHCSKFPIVEFTAFIVGLPPLFEPLDVPVFLQTRFPSLPLSCLVVACSFQVLVGVCQSKLTTLSCIITAFSLSHVRAFSSSLLLLLNTLHTFISPSAAVLLPAIPSEVDSPRRLSVCFAAREPENADGGFVSNHHPELSNDATLKCIFLTMR